MTAEITETAAPAETSAIDAVYRDRSHILALLALHYPARIAFSDPNTPTWPVLTLETPHGQMAWHIHPGELGLFGHVRRADDKLAAAAYDGHSTEEKHARIRARVESFPRIG